MNITEDLGSCVNNVIHVSYPDMENQSKSIHNNLLLTINPRDKDCYESLKSLSPPSRKG